MSRWFRLYDEMLDDPKAQRLPPQDFKIWINLLCLASRNDGKLPCISDIAFALRISENDAVTMVERLHIAGLIDKRNGGPDGFRYSPHGWDKRQYKSDNSADRVKKHREKRNDECNVSCNVTETPPDTDTDTDADAETDKKDMSSDDDALTVDDVVEAWNSLAGDRGLAKIVKLTENRRKQIKARIREYDAEDWSTAMAAIYHSKFLCGENDRGWKADFDFLLQPKSFVKLLEGAYNK
jgi:hypothetical protein